MPLADALTYVPQIPMIRQTLIWPTLVVVQVAALGQLHSFWTLMFSAKKNTAQRGRRLRLHFIAAEFDMLIDFEVICNCFSRLFLVVANGKYFSFLCLAAVCALPLIRFRYVFRLWFVSCLFCTRILEHFRSALFVFCSFAICALSGGQKVDARSHFDASCQRACLLCFTLCPQPGPPTATPTAFATANYSTRAQWQMELGSCFRAPTNCQLICKANQSALNALVFSLFWVSVARRFFMRELPP